MHWAYGCPVHVSSAPTVRGSGPATAPSARLLLALTDVLRRLKRGMDDAGLDPAAFFVLLRASCSANARVSDLAAELGLDASTVSRHVKHLEAGGHLERTPDPQDRRASRICLSERGADVLQQVQATRAGLLDDATRGWSAADRGELVRLLERLAGDLAGD